MVNGVIRSKKLGACQGPVTALWSQSSVHRLTFLKLALAPLSYILLEDPRATDLCNSVVMVQRLLTATPFLIANDGNDPVPVNKQLQK